MKKNKITTVNSYINQFPKETQAKLQKLRQIIKASAPGSIEIISYNMPAFKIHRRILVYFAAFKNHIGLYALPSAVVNFKKELSRFKTSKGTIRFPLDKPKPPELVKKIIKFRVKENLKKVSY